MPTQNETRQQAYDRRWENYITKLQRLDELKAAGRYGYQLRMSKKAIAQAHMALHGWCHANQVECPACA